MTDEPSNEMPR